MLPTILRVIESAKPAARIREARSQNLCLAGSCAYGASAGIDAFAGCGAPWVPGAGNAGVLAAWSGVGVCVDGSPQPSKAINVIAARQTRKQFMTHSLWMEKLGE